MESKLKCAECGCPVEQDGDTLKRKCGHDESAVIADMEAVAYGESKVNE